jgi:hypothetical protein
MAPLPVFNKDPFSSALAIMAFPDDHQTAYLCSCWIIVQGMADVLIKHQPEAAAAHIVSKSAEFAQFFSEWHRRQQEGVFVGTLVTTMVSLIKQDRSVASWENAMNILIDNWDEAKLSRSKLQTLRVKYDSVQHILASFADSRSIHQTPSFSTELFFTKAMRIHHIITGWNRFRGAPEQDVFELPFDPSISTFLEEPVPPDLFPRPARSGRPRKSPS